MTDDETVRAWFAERIPPGWFDGLRVECDREEIIVIGTLPSGDGDPEVRAARFRKSTREQRIRIAQEAERRFGRKVAWGVEVAGSTELFTVLSVPAMTRLRMRERKVLDTLIDAGVARSRSDALAWCVRLVAANEDEWLRDLRDAFQAVARVRDSGPSPED